MPQTQEAKTEEHFRSHVMECRDGDFSGFECLNKALSQGQVSPLSVGTTDGEIQKFREAWIIQDDQLAVQYLAEARSGDFENFAELVTILDRRPTVKIRLELPAEEYFALIKQHNVRACRRIVEDCRDGDFSKLPELVSVVEKRGVLPGEIDTTEEELMSFVVQQYLQAGKQVVEQCRAGDFTNLIPLLHDLRNGTFSEADVDTTPEEVKAFANTGVGLFLNRIATECRAGSYRNLASLKSVLKTLPDNGLTGLEFDTEEIERWERLATLTGVRINRSDSGLVLT